MSRYAPSPRSPRVPVAALPFAPLFTLSLALYAILVLFLLCTAGAAAESAAGPVCTVAPGGAGADFATLQAAIDDNGCTTIEIQSGVYVERLQIGRSVALRGAGQDVTVLDAGQAGRAVNIVQGAVEISGMTIQNGLFDGPGGGIYVDPSADAVISATQILSSAANAAGGGIFSDGKLTILASTIAGNRARWFGGGVGGSGPITITECTIAGNSAGDGGGIALTGGSASPGAWRTVDRTAIVSNTATGGGGGLVVLPGDGGITVRVTRNRLAKNTAGSYGGGVYFSLQYGGPAQVLFDGNEITGSGGTSTSDASTVYLAGGSITFTNNIIAANQYEGILLGQLSGSNRIVNNTIWGNAASGITYRNDDLGDLVVANNIVAANKLFGIWLPRLAVLHSNDVWDNGNNYYPGQDRTGVDGNLSVLPILLNPAAGDWRLSPCSPLIDKGSSQDASAADFYGNPRPYGSAWDIGAAEYQGDGVCHHASLPLLGTIYPVYLPPGAYPAGRCAQKQLTHDGKVVGPLTECVTSVDVLGDGLMRFNFSWAIDLPPELDYIAKYPDTDNRNMYVTDNLGRRYDHVAVSGAATATTYLEDNVPVYGSFTFLPAGPGAGTFAFHDDDQGLLLDKIVLK